MQNVYILRKMCDLVEENIRNLKDLRVIPDKCGKSVVHLLIEKIQHDLRLVTSHDFDQVYGSGNILKYFRKERLEKSRALLLKTKNSPADVMKRKNVVFFIWSKISWAVFLVMENMHLHNVIPWVMLISVKKILDNLHVLCLKCDHLRKNCFSRYTCKVAVKNNIVFA